MRLRALLPLGLLALTSLALAQGVVLKRSPKVGDKSTYAITGTFQVQGVDVVLKGTTVEEVTKLEGDVVTMKSTTKMSVNVMGQDQDQPQQTETSSEKLNGTPVTVGGGDAQGSGLRLANLNQVFFPDKALAVGDAWSTEGKKDEKLDLPGYKIDYKLEGEEKVGTTDCWKITANAAEIEGDAPTKVKATYWIDKATGRTVHSIADLTDAVFRPEVPPLSGKMDIVLQP